jgi:monoterpene epsilon-lactone hydrolase
MADLRGFRRYASHSCKVAACALVVTIGPASACYSARSPAEEPAKPYAQDGTLNVSAYTLPQSDFVSEDFKKAYAKHLLDAEKWPQPPGMDAPKAEWDRFDALTDSLIFGDSVKFALEHYPVDIADTKIAGVHAGIITPRDGIDPKNTHRVLINLHGGGFIMGRGLTAGEGESVPIASIARIRVITLDYRQAPYHKFPAASEDVEVVYRELLKTYKPEAIGIYGCSAGGALTAQSVAWFQSKGLPRPGAVGIFCSAPVPFGQRGDSTMWGGIGIPSGPSFTVASTTDAVKPGPTGYMEGVDINDPRAFPGASEAVLARFPATLLISGTRAGDMSPAIVAHARFLKLGVDSSLYIMEGGQHGAYNIGENTTPEGRDTLNYIAHWFDLHLAR